MYRFIETLKIQDGKAMHIAMHNERLNRTRNHFFKNLNPVDLNNHIQRIPNIENNKIYRCTFEYSEKVEDVRLIEYETPSIKSLKVVSDNLIDYSFKYADRSALDFLYNRRENCDNIIIVKNGMVTDSLYANLAFYDGKNWYTPENPLLKGTKRSLLIKENRIREKAISLKDIYSFQKLCLINAMLDLNQYTIKIDAIRL